MLNDVVGLIQEIQDAEVSLANMRDRLDAAWAQFLAQDKPLPSESPAQHPPLMPAMRRPEEVVQVPQAAADSTANKPNHLH